MLLALVVLGAALLGRVLDASQWVEHTSQVRLTLVRLEAVLLEAETAQRGYLATGDRAFLAAYDKGLTEWRPLLERAHTLTADNPPQQRRIEQLEALVVHRLATMQRTIEARDAGARDGELATPMLEGERDMNAVRDALAAALDVERKLDVQRARARAVRVDLAYGALVAAAVALMIAVARTWAANRLRDRLDEQQRRWAVEITTLNERLGERALELAEANHELEAFSYSVSHDLRAPIRHIAGFAELLERRCSDGLNDLGRHYVRTISDSANRAGELIDHLLAFSRMSRAGLEHEKVDMNACVADVWRALAPDRAGRNVELRAGTLPIVTGDPVMLRAVVQNLLSNAVKYTRPRDAAVIEVGARDEDGQPVVYVRDNGVGFDMRYADKLFGVFQRLHGPEAFEGVGIGLANVKRIVQRHGGRVWAEGAVDEGATFYVALRRAGQASATPGAA